LALFDGIEWIIPWEGFFISGCQALKGEDEVIDWLLEEDNPTVRYLTLRHLLKRKEGDGEVEEARSDIMRIGPVPKILAKQLPEGHWGRPEDFYMRSKYKGTVWNLILLAELHADPRDERVRKACEFVLRWSQDPASGGFSHLGSEEGGRTDKLIPCLTANMAFSLIRLGMLEDPRVQRALDWIVRYQRFDLTPFESREWPYQYDHCWWDHTCRSSVAKALKALAEVPEDKRSKGMGAAIEKAREFFLVQNIYMKGPGSRAKARPEWLHLGFPLMWNTDLLELLNLLLGTGGEDSRMHDAEMMVIKGRKENGRWLQENRYPGRYLVALERNGAESKWITLNALRMLEALPR
jgi:hypothetical protein